MRENVQLGLLFTLTKEINFSQAFTIPAKLQETLKLSKSN